MGYLTIKLQNYTWYKCLNLSLKGSRTCVPHIHTEGHTFVQKDIHSYARTEKWKNICPRHHPMRGHKNEPVHDKTYKNGMCTQWRQSSLSICLGRSESSMCAQKVAKDLSFLHADSEDSDQTGRMPRLIWVFAGRTCHFVGFVLCRLIHDYRKSTKK